MTGALQLTVFDIDGTLVDSQREIVAAMRAAFESCAAMTSDCTDSIESGACSASIQTASTCVDNASVSSGSKLVIATP